jgi:hypothetical protein
MAQTRSTQTKEAVRMKKAVQLTVGMVCLSLMLVSASLAQDQYTEGTVERVNLIRILPGHFNGFMEDIKTNLQPIWEAEKANGLIMNYHVFFNQTKSSAEDWDIGVSLEYKNMASLDGLAQKVLDLRMKQYGDKSKEQKVIDKRVESAQTVASYLIRNITVK